MMTDESACQVKLPHPDVALGIAARAVGRLDGDGENGVGTGGILVHKRGPHGAVFLSDRENVVDLRHSLRRDKRAARREGAGIKVCLPIPLWAEIADSANIFPARTVRAKRPRLAFTTNEVRPLTYTPVSGDSCRSSLLSGFLAKRSRTSCREAKGGKGGGRREMGASSRAGGAMSCGVQHPRCSQVERNGGKMGSSGGGKENAGLGRSPRCRFPRRRRARGAPGRSTA